MSLGLAYLFWHWPAIGIDRAVYEARLEEFHKALARPGSVTFRASDGAPISRTSGPVYLDWYPVADWAELGALNAEAVRGRRRRPHDAVAALSGGGHGEVRARLRGNATPGAASTARWTAKPAGVPYEDHLAALDEVLGPGDALWQRQMVLGVAPELCVLSSRPEESGGRGEPGETALISGLATVAVGPAP